MLCENCKKDIKQKTKGICEACGDKFVPTNATQRFCGSLKEKWGCAYRRRLDKQNSYTKKYQQGTPREYNKKPTEYKFIVVNIPEQREERVPEKQEYWFMPVK